MRWFWIPWVLGGLWVATPAVAQPTHNGTASAPVALTATERDLVASLSGLETVPEAKDWAARAPGTDRALLHVVGHDAVPLFVRVRAAYALQFFPTEATFTVLRALALGPAEPVLRREAVLSLARGVGARAAGTITSLANDPSPVVRRGVARALGYLGDHATLLARRKIEKDAGVRHAIDVALASGPTDRSPSR